MTLGIPFKKDYYILKIIVCIYYNKSASFDINLTYIIVMYKNLVVQYNHAVMQSISCHNKNNSFIFELTVFILHSDIVTSMDCKSRQHLNESFLIFLISEMNMTVKVVKPAMMRPDL